MELKSKFYIVDDEGEKFMGIGVLWLLEKTGQLGSLRKAAKDMTISYTKAYNMISRLEEALGLEVLERRKGGSSRDGATLTPFAIAFMKAYREGSDTPIMPLKGKKVAVVGGGNVAMDAARCSKRLGADVYIIYRRSEAELPARREEVEHAKEEGIIFKTLTNPVEIHGDENGFVVDFGKLKFIRKWIDENLDHACVFAKSDPLKDKLVAAAPCAWKIYEVDSCSCEGLAAHLLEVFDRLVREHTDGRVWVCEVRVSEDKKNEASAFKDK